MHKYSEKLTVEQRQEIVRRAGQGEAYKDLAAEFHIHSRTVQKMATGGGNKYPGLELARRAAAPTPVQARGTPEVSYPVTCPCCGATLIPASTGGVLITQG